MSNKDMPDHIALVEAVNNSKTEAEHCANYQKLRAFRDQNDTGGNELMACDWHYIEQGIERPMCCGVFLDWMPKPEAALAELERKQ